MFTDNDLLVAKAQAITAAALSDKSIDLGAAIQPGVGEPLHPFMRVTSDADLDPTTSLTVEVIGADDAGLSSNVVTLCSKSILKAALVKNSIHYLPPVGLGSAAKQYMGMKFTPVGGNATQGKVTAGFVLGGYKAP
jgi:hypothetical protein